MLVTRLASYLDNISSYSCSQTDAWPVEEDLDLRTLGLPFSIIEEVNEKLKVQAVLEINVGYGRSEISRADTLAGAEVSVAPGNKNR